MPKQPILSIVFYANKRKENLSNSLINLQKINSNDVELIIFSDDAIPSVQEAINLFLLNQNKNIVYVQNKESLGPSFCFNTAICFARGKYIIFWDCNHLIDVNINQKIKKYLEKKTYDIVVLADDREPFYRLESHEINELNEELILYCASNGMSGLLFSLDFLKTNKISFVDLNWYPDVFLARVLIKFKSLLNLTDKVPVITYKKEVVFHYNIYDYLYQVDEFFRIITKYGLYEKFKDAFDFWIVLICINNFVKKIFQTYAIKISNKESMKKNSKIILTAINHIISITNKYIPNFEENKFFKPLKTKITRYFVMSCKVIGLVK